MYEKTLGLNDNPFNPQFPGKDAGELLNLGGEPLPLDLATQHPELKALFCLKLKAVAENEAKAREVLFGLKLAETARDAGDTVGAAGSGDTGGVVSGAGEGAASSARDGCAQKNVTRQPVVLVVTGNKGAGKTTFANYLAQVVLAAAALKTSTDLASPCAWRQFRREFSRCDGPDLKPFIDEVNALELHVLSQIGDSGSNPLLTLDNVPKGGFERIAEFHKKLKKHFAVFIVTTEDSALKQSELDWNFSSKTQLLPLSNVTIEESRLYIGTRVSQFRSPRRPEIDRVSLLFPFAVAYPSAEETQPQPLRVLNRRLEREIEARHRKQMTESGPDVRTCPEEKLAEVLIR